MKALKKLTTAIVSCAFILSSASAVLADETTTASQPSETATSSETQETFDISKMKFETMYGNQIQDFLGHQYVFEGQKIPVAESNFYFLQTFLQETRRKIVQPEGIELARIGQVTSDCA
ncbi:MAG: hypothetical protein IK001_01520 [Lachnospiraceae bacterium]|nr:hypothetical protein [Lachnospiraceae bacterium]